jgi:hypothetical protein
MERAEADIIAKVTVGRGEGWLVTTADGRRFNCAFKDYPVTDRPAEGEPINKYPAATQC